MELIKYVIESDAPVLINKEYVAQDFPVCVQWFKGNSIVVENVPESVRAGGAKEFQQIKITDRLYILRNGERKKGKTELVPFLFLESVRRKDFERARRYLNFDISDNKLEEYFGDFEILVNNYLDDPNVFSILPNNTTQSKNFVFETKDKLIFNISDFTSI